MLTRLLVAGDCPARGWRSEPAAVKGNADIRLR